MSAILKRTSFGLLRTNPKLTTNIKIVADSKDKVYLESIDADPLLTKSIYKGFEVTGGSYSRDLNRFYSQGAKVLPKSISYQVFEIDESVNIKDRYKDQYDFLYDLGMQPKNSRIYSEEFSMFAPLWIEPGNEPDYFLIFKMDGPSTINYNQWLVDNPNSSLDNDSILNDIVTLPENFFDNYISKAKIIKTFDLKGTSSIGRYIRNHSEDPLFPESSIYASLSKGALTYWQGISYSDGGFARKAQDIYSDYVLIDKTVTENDDFVTMGFYNNEIVHPNILNMEFLFDDEEQEDYRFSRYFGMYVSEAELGKFEIDGNRLYQDRDVEYTQTPSPIKNQFGYSSTTIDAKQVNDRGIKVYPKLNAGGTGPYSGRLINWSETQNPRFPYIKSISGNFYSIDSNIGWTSTYMNGPTATIEDDRFLRIKNKTVNWKDFTGFEDPFTFIEALQTDQRGRPNFSFEVIGTVSSGDQIRIGYTDWTNPAYANLIDKHTISGDTAITAGKNTNLSFSVNGTKEQVALAIANAINYIQTATTEHQIFSAIAKGNRVIVFSRLDSENWDKLRYSLFSTSTTYPFSKPNEFQPITYQAYLPSPISVTALIPGDYFEYRFTGGCDNSAARFVINTEDFQEFVDETDPVFVNTTNGFDLVGEYSIYLDEPVLNSVGHIVDFNNIDKYMVYHIKNTKYDITFNSSKKLALYKTAKNSLGYLSIFPLRDFDYNSLDISYSKDADSSYTNLDYWYQGDIFNQIESAYPSLTYVGTVGHSEDQTSVYNTGSSLGWNSQAYNAILTSGPQYASAKPSTNSSTMGFGLCTDPASTNSWWGFEYLWYFYDEVIGFTAQSANPTAGVFEWDGTNAIPRTTLEPYTSDDVFAITYDTYRVKYWKNGILMYTSTTTPTGPLYFNSIYWRPNFGFNDIRLGKIKVPTFDFDSLDPDYIPQIESILGPNSPFAVSGGFQSLGGISDDFLDTNDKVYNEYDRLKENILPEIALSSKVVPFINKWVYDNESNDVRENPYRLNTDQSFGYSNFSPSFDELGRNPKFFTHEWYYLQKYPPYMSFEEKVNSFSYFDEDLNYLTLPIYGGSTYAGATALIVGGTGATANLMSNAEDYFLSYFTRETIDGVDIPRDFRYSIFEYGTETVFAETLFRGAKVIIKDRSEFSPIDYNIESIRFLANPVYNGYKFSSVLTYSNSGTQLIFIKNDKWKSVTLVILSDLNDEVFMKYKEGNTSHKFIDRSHLYTLNSKLELASGATGDTLKPRDVNIGGEIYAWDWTGTNWLIKARQDKNGNNPNFSSDLTLNPGGNYNHVRVETAGYGIEFVGIRNPTSSTFECDTINSIGFSPPFLPTGSSTQDLEMLPIGATGYPGFVYDPTHVPPLKKPAAWAGGYFPIIQVKTSIGSQIIYNEGGYNGYLPIMDSISFGTIANQVNSGDSEIKYITIKEDDSVVFNQYAVEIVRPDYPVKSTYLKPKVLSEKPVDLQSSAGIIGYELTAMDRIDIHQISRYRGAYNPKWRDVIKFIDTDEIKAYIDLEGNSLSYNNVQILTKLVNPDSRVLIEDTNLFYINNLYFNKVNVESPNVILRFSESNARTIFPLLGEVAIDHKDYFLFKSNWDTNYFNKYLKSTVNVPQIGTREPKENKSFFGSKVIAVPNLVRIETFPQGIIPKKELGSISKIKTVKQNIVSEVKEVSKNRILTLQVFTGLALQDWMIKDGIGSDFYKYINANYSFGDPNQEDDIKTYIAENVYDRYIVKEVILWQKFWKKGNTLPPVEVNMTDEQKIAAGYTQTKNFQAKFANPDDLDFQLIYNIPLDRNYSIAFTVILEKK